MFEKYRHPWSGKEVTWRTITSAIIFGAIILVFALFGIGGNDRAGMSAGGGSAAVVNDTSISVAAWQRAVQNNARNSGLPLDKLPAEQRERYQKMLSQQVLQQLVQNEVAYQAASKDGIVAANGQVRDMLMTAPIFQDNGRFVRDRYDMYLQQLGQTSDEFEHELKKQIVLHRLIDMFSSAGAPTAAEVQQLSELESTRASIRYVELMPEKLQNEKAVSEKEVSAFLADPANKEKLKKYYDDHMLDFQLAEKAHARDILLRIDDKNPEKQVLEKAKALRAKLTPQNFASVAEKESQDPRTAKKGGDMGTFERGHMDPRIDNAVFEMKAGGISQPIKTEIGYVIVFAEEHTQARTVAQDEANPKIARILIGQTNAPVALAALKKAAESGSSAEADATVKKYGLEWQKAEDVNLASPTIPRVAGSDEVLKALAENNGKTGLIRQVIGKGEHQYLVEVMNWKKSDKPATPKEELQKNLAMQTSEDALNQWARLAASKASITLNQKLLER